MINIPSIHRVLHYDATNPLPGFMRTKAHSVLVRFFHVAFKHVSCIPKVGFVTLAYWVRPPGDPTVCKAFQTSFREGQFFLGQNHLNSNMVVNLGWNFQKIWLLPPNKNNFGAGTL